MMPSILYRTTLTQFLINERRRFPSASGDFNGLILDVASACKAISRAVAYGDLDDLHGRLGGGVASAPGQTRHDIFSHNCFLRCNQASGTLAGMISTALAQPYPIPPDLPRGKYLLAFDPLDGAANIDVNAPLGSIFSVLRAPEPGRDVTEADFLQAGRQQVAAGYALYGAATLLFLSVGNGVYGFTLDPSLGDFLLTHLKLQVPAETQEFAINSSRSRFWETPVKRYVNECLQGTTGPRGQDFNMRWIASSVADTHRVLLRGGAFLNPCDSRTSASDGRLQLLCQANPLSFLVEQAGGRASTGSEPVLAIQPSAIHQRVGLVLGSRCEVERIERYHESPNAPLSGDPLFATRGLFRD